MGRFNDEALNMFSASGYARGTSQADRKAIARDYGDLLMADPIAGPTDEEVQDKAPTPSEIRHKLMGKPQFEETEQQLDDLFGEIGRPDGELQEYLNAAVKPNLDDPEADGTETKTRYVLCSARAKRSLTNGDGEVIKTISVTVRYASNNPEQVENRTVQPQLNSLERSAATTRRRIDRATDVVPALQARKAAWLTDANERIQRELPSGEAQAA